MQYIMKRKTLNVLSVLLGLLLLNSGLVKFFHYIPVPDNLPDAVVKDNLAFAEIVWLLPLIGFAEVLGGLLILFPRTRALGTLVIFPVMAGVLLTHIFVAPDGLPMAIAVWAIMLWIFYDNRRKFLPLVRK